MAQNFTYFTQWIRMGILYLYFPYTEKVVCQQSEIPYAGRVFG